MAKEIWTYLVDNNLHLTAEYLPGLLNKEADWQSRNHTDASEWKLDSQVFKNLCSKYGQPSIDLFASRLSNQLETFYSY